jgi:hypothetical protein
MAPRRGDTNLVQGMEAGIGRDSPARLDAAHDSPTRPCRDAPDPVFSPWTDGAASKESTTFPVSSIDDAERIKNVLINH